MTSDDSTKNAAKNLDTKALGLLEKVNEFQWALQILSVVLFADTVLLISTGKNILSYQWSHFLWSEAFGVLIIYAIGYSVLASALIPFVEACIGEVVRFVYYRFLCTFFEDRDVNQRGRGRVRYWELKEHADRTQSTYALARYKEWEAATQKQNDEIFQIGRMSFRTLFLLLANFQFSTALTPSTIFTLAEHLTPDAFALSSTVTLLFLFGLGCRSWCRTRYPTEWISYMPLYEQIEEKRQLELQQQRQLTEEFERRVRHMRSHTSTPPDMPA